MVSLPVIGSVSVLVLILIAFAAFMIPLFRTKKSIQKSIEEELHFPGGKKKDTHETLRIVFSFNSLFRLTQQATVFVQNVVDEAVEGGIDVLGAKVLPEVRVHFADGDFFERAGVPWVALITQLDIELDTKVLGQKISLKRALKIRLEAPAAFDPGDKYLFHVSLDFKAVRVLEPEESSRGGESEGETTGRVQRSINTALRTAISAGVLQRLGKINILSLSHDLLGERAPLIHPGEIRIDEANKQIIFGLKTDLGLQSPLPVGAIEEVHDKEFAVVALPEILRSLADAALVDQDMRWNLRGVPVQDGPIRIGVRDIDLVENKLKLDLSVLHVRFPWARIDLRVAVRTGALEKLEVYQFFITSHPLLEFVTRRIDNLPMLRGPLSMALRRAFMLKPIALPSERALSVEISEVHSSPHAVGASGRISIREGNNTTFVQLK